MPEMHLQTDAKLITCVLPKGRARKLHQALIDQQGIETGNWHGARGVGREAKLYERGIGEQLEREIFEVTVPADRADELFEFMFFESDMDERHGGIIYITSLPQTSVWQAPTVEQGRQDRAGSID